MEYVTVYQKIMRNVFFYSLQQRYQMGTDRPTSRDVPTRSGGIVCIGKRHTDSEDASQPRDSRVHARVQGHQQGSR